MTARPARSARTLPPAPVHRGAALCGAAAAALPGCAGPSAAARKAVR